MNQTFSAGRKTLKAAGTGLTLAAATLLLPQAGVAQACIGSPAMTGQIAAGGVLLTADGLTGYGGEILTNPGGPLALGASIGVIDADGIDDNIFTAGANAAWEIPRGQLSLCPVVGVEYQRWPSSDFGDLLDYDFSVISVPVGLGAGARLGSGNVHFIPSAEAGLLWQRYSFSASEGGVSISDSETESDFYFRGGATAVTGRFYGRAALQRIFEDNAENVFRFSVGVLF